MKKLSILAIAAATFFGTLYAESEPVKDEPIATTESTEETQGETHVSCNNENEEEGKSSFLAANTDEESKGVEDERIA